jgi:hypothetical protein
MTLGEIKKKALALIEELDSETTLTTDEDILKKLNYIVNQIQNELARFKKLPAREVVEITEANLEYDLNDLDLFYQVQVIRGLEAEIFGTTAMFKNKGTADIRYYKYPTQVNANTKDTQELDLPIDLVEIMPYGIAADLLKSDVSNGYGQVYANRYQEMIQSLDPRHSLGSIYIDAVEV